MGTSREGEEDAEEVSGKGKGNREGLLSTA